MAGEAGKGHDSKSMRRRKARRRSSANDKPMAWRRASIRPVAERTVNLDPVSI